MANKFTIEAVFKSVDRMTAPISKMQKRVNRFTRAMKRGMSLVNKSVVKLIRLMSRGFVAAAALFTAAVTAISVALKSVADRADALSKQSRMLEFPIKALQEWQFVAEQSGLTLDTFNKALGILLKQMGQLKLGQGLLVTVLKRTNIPLLRQLQHTKDSSKAFELLLNAMRKIKDPSLRAGLAVAAFGKQGLKLIVMAKTSAKQLAKLREEARKNGLITKKQAEAAEAFNDQLNSLKRTFIGVLQQALLPLMPIIKEYLHIIQDWILAHRELIKTNIQKFVREGGEAIKFLWKEVKKLQEIASRPETKKFLSQVVTAVKFLGDHIATITKVGGALIGLMVILNIFTGVMTAVNIVMSLNPVVLMAGAFIAMGAAIAYVVTHLGKLKSLLSSLSPTSVLRSIMPGGIVLRSESALGKQISEFFGGGGTQSQMVSPASRTASAITENRTVDKSEITILDNTNRASVTKGKLSNNVKLQQSGAF